MSASNELEKSATAYALDAVRLDKQGQKGRAITLYQKAIESLLQLVQLYPEYGLNKVYVQRAIAYQERIKALQGAVSSTEMNEASNSDNQMAAQEQQWKVTAMETETENQMQNS